LSYYFFPWDNKITNDLNKSLAYLPYYQNKKWAKQFEKELNEYKNQQKISQYLGVVRKDYQGAYINVSKNGDRKTWNSQPFPDPNSSIVFLFGGSAMFGYGSRDDYTIASQLSRLLNQNLSRKYYVYNYGQIGFTFTQEVFQLILLLREGKKPDIAIFYDGVNEIYHAHYSGEAGTTMPFKRIQQKLALNEPTAIQHILIGYKDLLENYSTIYKALGKITTQFEQKNSVLFKEVHNNKIAKEIVEYYLKTYSILDALSKSFHFEYLCLLQPVLFLEDSIMEINEIENATILNDKQLKHLYHKCYVSIRNQSPKNFFDLSNCLQDRSIPLYNDFCHLNEIGDQEIAMHIYNVLYEKQYLKTLTK